MTAKTIRSKSQSRAVKRLRVHNQSLEKEFRSHSHNPVVEEVHDQTARERSLNHSDRQGLPQSSNDPQIGLQSCFCSKRSTERYRREFKRLKAELGSKLNKAQKHKETRPKFKIKGNKKQYQLNKNVLKKIKAAKDVGDNDLRKELLEEGEQLLTEHKHICITEKYGRSFGRHCVSLQNSLV